MNISLFNDTWTTTPEKTITFSQALKAIKSDKYKDQVELIRKLKQNEDANYKEEKKKLPAVTFSGTFTKRLASDIIDYSGLLCIDIDNIDVSDLRTIRGKLENDKYVLALFLSPSGDGIKLVLYCPECVAENHQSFYFTAEKYFRETYGIEIDRACKDVSRLCYLSYDPEAYVAKEVTTFPVNFDIRQVEFFAKNTLSYNNLDPINTDTEKCFRMAVKWTERIFIFEPGQRNKYIHNLACTLNRLGVSLEKTIQLIDSNYITPDKKWIQSVNSAYKHNAAQFNTEKLKQFDPTNSEAIPYVEKPFNYGDSEKSIRRIVKRMLEKNFPVDVVKPMTETYILVYKNFLDQDIIDSEGLAVVADHIINCAKEELKENELVRITPISSSSLYDAGMEIKNLLSQKSEFTSGIDGYDEFVPGIFSRGNVIGVIGRDKTFKSVMVQNMAYQNARSGLPGLYVNGEMSKGQFIKRAVKINSGHNFDYYLEKKESIPDDVYNQAMLSLKENVDNRLQLHCGKDFSRKGIADLIKKFRNDGIDISYVVIDGISQMNDEKNDEIKSAIFNAMELKELAKEENVLVIVLIHMKSGFDKTLRDTGEKVRGGNKMTANMDAYFSTSLFEIPQQEDTQDKKYYPGVFHLLLNDKRGSLDMVYKVIEVSKDLKLKVSDKEPRDYEL